MKPQDRLFINGRYVEALGNKRIEVLNPATNETLAEVHRAEGKDFERAIDAANAIQGEWGQMTPWQRSAALHRVGDAIERNLEFLAQLETDDVGKPIFESRNVDIASGAATFHYFADACMALGGEVKPSPYNEVLDYTVREPLGVVGAIIPWNFPFLIACRKIATALAAGNTMVIKPASWAPMSTLQLGQIFSEADVPPGVLNICPSSGSDAGKALAGSPMVEELSFTGSTQIGRLLYSGCCDPIKGITLELGGKSPGLVLPDCDLDETIAGTLFGAFLNQGECCCALTRLVVHEDIYDTFVPRFVEASRGIRVGMPREDDTRMGPMVHPDQLKSVMDLVQSGQDEGATLLCGGEILRDGALAKGNFMSPAVFADVKSGMRIWREEIFGPVVVITRAADVEDMVAQANDTNYGLAASVWTTNLKAAHTLARRIDAGTVWFNLHNFVFPSAPYAGYKESGLGSELGIEGLRAMTRVKNVMVSLFPNGFQWY